MSVFLVGEPKAGFRFGGQESFVLLRLGGCSIGEPVGERLRGNRNRGNRPERFEREPLRGNL